jgi:hypothetical protein
MKAPVPVSRETVLLARVVQVMSDLAAIGGRLAEVCAQPIGSSEDAEKWMRHVEMHMADLSKTAQWMAEEALKAAPKPESKTNVAGTSIAGSSLQ